MPTCFSEGVKSMKLGMNFKKLLKTFCEMKTFRNDNF